MDLTLKKKRPGEESDESGSSESLMSQHSLRSTCNNPLSTLQKFKTRAAEFEKNNNNQQQPLYSLNHNMRFYRGKANDGNLKRNKRQRKHEMKQQDSGPKKLFCVLPKYEEDRLSGDGDFNDVVKMEKQWNFKKMQD